MAVFDPFEKSQSLDVSHPIVSSFLRGNVADALRLARSVQAGGALTPEEQKQIGTIGGIKLRPSIGLGTTLPSPETISAPARSRIAELGGEITDPLALALGGSAKLSRLIPGGAVLGAAEAAGTPTTKGELGFPTKVGLGTVIGGGTAAAASLLPFVGKIAAHELAGRGAAPLLRETISQRTKGLLNNLRGNSTNLTAANDVVGNMKQYFHELQGSVPLEEKTTFVPHEQSVGEAYRRFEDLRNKVIPLSYNKTNIAKAAAKEIKPFQQELDTLAEGSPSRVPLKRKIAVLKEESDRSIKNFNDADIAKRAINRKIRGLWAEDQDLASPLRNIKEAVRQSMRVNAAGHPELANALENADSRYAKEIVPFKKIHGTQNPTKFWEHITTGKGSPEEILSDAIRPGARKDQVTSLNRFLQLIPKTKASGQIDAATRQKLGYWFLKTGEDNPKELMRLYNSLGEGQKLSLFGADVKPELDNLSALHKVAPGAFTPGKPSTSLIGALGSLGIGGAGIALGHPMLGLALASAPHLAKGIGEQLGFSAGAAKRIENLLLKQPVRTGLKTRALHFLSPSATIGATRALLPQAETAR